MPGLDPGVHEAGSGAARLASSVDGRDEPGHDESVAPPKALANAKPAIEVMGTLTF